MDPPAPKQLPLLSEVVRELPGLRVALNHLGFCPHDMWVDEHRRPRFDDPFPESTVQQALRLSEAGGVHLVVSGQYALSVREPPYPDLFRVPLRFSPSQPDPDPCCGPLTIPGLATCRATGL